MIPRFSPAYYKLPSPEKVLYLTGMPFQYIKSDTREFEFKNEQTGKKVLTGTTQKKVFEQLLNHEMPPGLAVFASNPTDHEAMQAISFILRTQYKQTGFKDFEYVHPSESIPAESERKIVYILQSCHALDLNLTHQIRRWVRTSHGGSVWICLTAPKPYEWCSEHLGIKPSFLFSIKGSGVSVG